MADFVVQASANAEPAAFWARVPAETEARATKATRLLIEPDYGGHSFTLRGADSSS
jgi:hypothetical protein